MFNAMKRLAAVMLAFAFFVASVTGASAFSPNSARTATWSHGADGNLIIPVRRGHRRNLGLGILGGVAAAVIINEAAKAEDRRSGDDEVMEARRCRRLHFRCKDGDPRACDAFDDYC